MRRLLASFVAGGLFGAGLLISQMTNPDKVLSFLDIFGDWDPSLAFVMGAALLVTLIGYRFVLRRSAPLFEGQFRLPTRTDIDGRLIGGAALFGAGWGLAGLCPGPAMASLSFGGLSVLVFVIAMLAPILILRRFGI
jgi:uncharacterized membrane protein YedE/YeeE